MERHLQTVLVGIAVLILGWVGNTTNVNNIAQAGFKIQLDQMLTTQAEMKGSQAAMFTRLETISSDRMPRADMDRQIAIREEHFKEIELRLRQLEQGRVK